jgi:hypothetical protein
MQTVLAQHCLAHIERLPPPHTHAPPSPDHRSVSRFLTEKGFYETWDFFDSFTWYPLGRVVGGTMYPGGGVCVWGGGASST